MGDELERRSGASPSGVFVLLFLAGTAFATAVAEYNYARAFEQAGGHPPFVHSRTGRVDVRRTPIGKVAERVQPRAGVWACVAVFAVPGLFFLVGAAWQFRRPKPA